MLFALPALATTPEISVGRWSVTPAPRPTLLNHRAVLGLLPTAEAVRYAVHSGWAETVAGAPGAPGSRAPWSCTSPRPPLGAA